MSTFIPFGEWLPDLPPTGLQGATSITNVLPHQSSYFPFPTAVIVSNALGSKCLGGIFASDPAGNNYNYAGDASALYRLVQTSYTLATRAVGGPYTLANDDYWEFVNWGNTVIGINGFTDPPQQISLGAVAFTDLSVGVKGKHITLMKDFVVMGNVSDSAANSYRVRWCGINNPSTWTPSAATMADYQDLPSDGGPIQKVLGGEYGVILQQRSIWRMIFIGAPLIFQFDQVHNLIGAYVPQAAIRYQNMVFFLSSDGFYSFDGNVLKPIGVGKVDKFFFNDMATTYAQRINAVIDPYNKLVMWAYPSSESIGGNPDKLIVYSWVFERWTLISGLDIQYMLQNITNGYTLDGLDSISTNLDTGFAVSFDSIQWTGGQIILAAFNASNQLTRFNGSAMAVTCDTGEFQLYPDRRARITSVRPVIDGVGVSASISIVRRNNLNESPSATAALTPNAIGYVPVRVNARYFRIRLQTTLGSNFTHLTGVEVEAMKEGKH